MDTVSVNISLPRDLLGAWYANSSQEARTLNRCNAVTELADDYWDGVALNLHGFYGAVERSLEDIARTVEQSVPAGPG